MTAECEMEVTFGQVGMKIDASGHAQVLQQSRVTRYNTLLHLMVMK
jgi:hypothetical protein